MPAAGGVHPPARTHVRGGSLLQAKLAWTQSGQLEASYRDSITQQHPSEVIHSRGHIHEDTQPHLAFFDTTH